MNVLIVDDSALIVSNIVELLEEVVTVCSIMHSSTYHHSVTTISNKKPDVVLLDINLPDKSGIQLLKHIKEFFPETRVIMVTNQSNDFYRRLCLKMGAEHYIDKSIDFHQIPSLVSSLS